MEDKKDKEGKGDKTFLGTKLELAPSMNLEEVLASISNEFGLEADSVKRFLVSTGQIIETEISPQSAEAAIKYLPTEIDSTLNVRIFLTEMHEKSHNRLFHQIDDHFVKIWGRLSIDYNYLPENYASMTIGELLRLQNEIDGFTKFYRIGEAKSSIIDAIVERVDLSNKLEAIEEA